MPDKRERPADFEERAAAGMTFAQLRAHYSCGKGTLARWFAEGPPPRASLRGKHLPGAVAALTPDQAREMTARRWKTRKDRYGPSGHRKGAASPSNPENEQ